MKNLNYASIYSYTLTINNKKITKELTKEVCFAECFNTIHSIIHDNADSAKQEQENAANFTAYGTLTLLLRRFNTATRYDNMYFLSKENTAHFLSYLKKELCKFNYTLKPIKLNTNKITNKALLQVIKTDPEAPFLKLTITLNKEDKVQALKVKALLTLIRYLYETEYAVALHDAYVLKRIEKYSKIPLLALINLAASIRPEMGRGHCYFPYNDFHVLPNMSIYKYDPEKGNSIMSAVQHLKGECIKSKAAVSNNHIISRPEICPRPKKTEKGYKESVADSNWYYTRNPVVLHLNDKEAATRLKAIKHNADDYLATYSALLTN